MLKQTTLKLSLSILSTSLVAVVLTFIILLTFGSIGASSKSSASSAASSLSSSVASGQGAASAAAAGQPASGAEGGLLGSLAGKIFLGGACILITAALVYTTAWHEGNRDPNRVNYGHMRYFPAKGLVAGSLASAPYFILWLCFLISHKVWAGSAAATVFEVVFRICNLQYVVLNDSLLQQPALCFVFLLPLPLFSAAGYLAGYRRFAILPRLVYKKSKGAPKASVPGYTIKKAKGGDWTKK